MLIIGGNSQSFAAVGQAYTDAIKSSVGTVRTLLPDALQKTVSRVFIGSEYAPSTPSGSFSSKALATVLDNAAWADGVLLPGDLGRNSETAILFEQLLSRYHGPVCLTQDAVDYFIKLAPTLLSRAETLLVPSLAQLQSLAINIHFEQPFTSSMDLLRLVDTLHAFTERHQVAIITKHLSNVIASYNGKVTTTRLNSSQPAWQITTAARASVWWLQNPAKLFEAITTSLSQSD